MARYKAKPVRRSATRAAGNESRRKAANKKAKARATYSNPALNRTARNRAIMRNVKRENTAASKRRGSGGSQPR